MGRDTIGRDFFQRVDKGAALLGKIAEQQALVVELVSRLTLDYLTWFANTVAEAGYPGLHAFAAPMADPLDQYLACRHPRDPEQAVLREHGVLARFVLSSDKQFQDLFASPGTYGRRHVVVFLGGKGGLFIQSGRYSYIPFPRNWDFEADCRGLGTRSPIAALHDYIRGAQPSRLDERSQAW